jgi:hypothetical protein
VTYDLPEECAGPKIKTEKFEQPFQMFLRQVATRLLRSTTANKAVSNSNLLLVLKRNMATENKQNTTWVKDIKDGEFVRKGN